MKKSIVAIMVTGIVLGGCSSKPPQLGEASIDDVVNAMTLEEKVLLLIGKDMDKQEDGNGAVVGTTTDMIPGAAGTTHAIPRLGIPSIVLADGPAGLRINPTREGDDKKYYATHFPIGTLLACTWDTNLVENVGQAIGNEVLEYGVDVLLAPGMNIQRHPLNGRNFEYYSEDPLVSGKIASAYVKGVQSNGVGTSVKHFVANNQETNRTATDAIVSQRALREIYLKGFEIAVKEAQPWTLMTSYNLLNGIYTSENPELLTTLLRNEWKYQGMVMTDWFGGKDAPAQVRAGNDMIQPGYRKQYDDIIEAVNNGSLDVKDVDRNVKRILELIVKTPKFKGYKYSNNPDLRAHATVTRQSAAEGMVLLKNDNKALPFSPQIKKIALFGNTSYDFIPGGTGSGNVNGAYTVSLLEGLKNAGYTSDNELKNIYEEHIAKEKMRLAPKEEDTWAAWLPPKRPEEIIFAQQELNNYVANNDAAIITMGIYSGEFMDRTSKDFDIPENMLKLIADVSRSFKKAGKPVIVILNVGGAVETASWKNQPDAILLAWQGGQEGGNSVADILCGKGNPSGKLTMTFPLKLTDPYSSIDFPIDINPNIEEFFNFDRKRGDVRNVDYTLYEDDIYVGYRYFESFDKPVSYPFGYGLSYTTFQYREPKLEKEGNKYIITIDITNIGECAGKEVVQLYVTPPNAKDLNLPHIMLKGFAKTKLLQPEETQIIKISLPIEELASFDEKNSEWIIYGGEYLFKICSSVKDIRGTVTVEVPSDSRKVDNILNLQKPIEILKRKP